MRVSAASVCPYDVTGRGHRFVRGGVDSLCVVAEAELLQCRAARVAVVVVVAAAVAVEGRGRPTVVRVHTPVSDQRRRDLEMPCATRKGVLHLPAVGFFWLGRKQQEGRVREV